jgi:hypothetical protein
MTTRRLALAIAVLSTCLAVRAARAQDSSAAAIHPSIETVVSGGVWAAGAAHGRYRVVVIMEGWETIRRRAVLQWVQETESPDSVETVRAFQDLTDTANAFSLGDPVLTRRTGRWYVSLRAADKPMAQYSRRVTFKLGPPGKARRI